MTTTARSPLGRPGGRTSRVLVAAGLSVLVAVALATLLGGLLDGRPAALGALVGGAVALGFFLFGSSVVNAATRLAPEAALLIALTTYALQVVLVAVVFVAIDRSGAVGETLSGGWLVGGLVAATVVWTVGQLVFSSRARVPVYDVGLPSDHPSPDGSHAREAGAS